MKIIRLLLPVFLVTLLFSCSKDDETGIEEEEVRDLEVDNYIYAAMNDIYLYNADVPELDDSYAPTQEERNDFLKTFESPEESFEGLLSYQDRFSFMYDDYLALEKMFSGVSTTNGMQLALYYYGTSNDILAVVNYVLPNTSAAEQGVTRGDMFISVDGELMTESNYSDLLAKTTYEIEIARLEGTTITPTGQTATLTQQEYSSNPVHTLEIIEKEGAKIGYLLYNGFTDDYNGELNDAFGELKAASVSDLVLDLRYNGGGSVATAVGLAGMITGQLKDEIFIKEQWNERYQNAWNPESYIYKFSDEITLNPGTQDPVSVPINSLGLNKVYVITTSSSASASELIINGLDPYIQVVQVGDTTTGKYEASATLYDSPNYNRDDANKNHTYAIQPLIFKSANADGKTDYKDGLVPDIYIPENLGNMGVLGDPEEPLLNVAINNILNKTPNQEKIAKAIEKSRFFNSFGETGMDRPTYQRMYIDKLPPFDKE